MRGYILTTGTFVDVHVPFESEIEFLGIYTLVPGYTVHV